MENPNASVVKRIITIRASALLAIPASTKPVMYSDISSGDPKKFKKLRDHESSINDMLMPCMTWPRKFKRSTAPSKMGMNRKPEPPDWLRYLVKNPHKIMSTVVHVNICRKRGILPRKRYNWRRNMA